MLAGDGVALAGLRLVNGRASAGARPGGRRRRLRACRRRERRRRQLLDRQLPSAMATASPSTLQAAAEAGLSLAAVDESNDCRNCIRNDGIGDLDVIE